VQQQRTQVGTGGIGEGKLQALVIGTSTK